MNQDILVLLEPGKYVDLLKILQENHLSDISASYLIKCLIEWNKIKVRKGPEWYPKVSKETLMVSSIYVPRSGLHNGTFLCVTNKKVLYISISGVQTIINVFIFKTIHPYGISFFSLQKNQEELVKCLTETKLIDWFLNPTFNAITSEQLPFLETLVKKKNLQLELVYTFNNYKMSKKKLFALPKIKYVPILSLF